MNRLLILIAVAMLLNQMPAVSAEKKPLSFRNVSMGEIEDKEATKAGFHTKGWTEAHFGFTSFKASNGKGLLVIYDDFETREEAKHFFDWKVERSFRVLSKTAKTNPNGNAVEYRAELTPELNHQGVELMWVVGQSLHVVSADNLEDASEFERWYRRLSQE
jgi:hypothetical protein